MQFLNKPIGIITGFVVFLWICYKIAIANTLEIRKEFNELSATQDQTREIIDNLSIYTQKEKELDSIIAKYDGSEHIIQNELFNNLNSLADFHDVTISNLSAPHLHHEEGIMMVTYMIRAQGDYKSLSNFMSQVEDRFRYGKALHLVYQKKQVLKTGKRFQECEIWLQRAVPKLGQ